MEEVQGACTVAEVGVLTQLSETTVVKMFENEKGVLIYEIPGKRKHASYRTARIPRHIRSGHTAHVGPGRMFSYFSVCGEMWTACGT